MGYDDERKKKRRTPYIVYTLLLAAALVTAVSSIAQASNFINTDGYINLSSSCTNLTNGTCTINYNTTRYASSTLDGILSASDWNRFNSSTSSNYSDGNNYTTAIAFERSSNNIILQNARNGLSNVSAFFTLQSTTGILTTNGITYANATNCTSGQYSRYENNGWNCYNDASGGSGTVTSITINSTTPSVSVVNPTVTTAGTVVIDIANATVFNDGLMTSTQATSLGLKSLAGNCAGYNSTHVNVTMNTTTAGPQCVAVSLNPGGGSSSGGNISGGSINGTAGYVATFNSTTTINASSLYVNPTTGELIALGGLTTGTKSTLKTLCLNGICTNNLANTSITPPSTAVTLSAEFMAVTSTSSQGWIGSAAISSGTGSAAVAGEIDHPGIVSASDSTTAGGGYIYSTANNAFLLNESEGFTIVLRAPGGKVENTQISAGFIDTAGTIIGNVDGCFFAYNLTGLGAASRSTINGRCRTNSVETNTSTNFTATNNTWYVMKGWLGISNGSGQMFNFSLYNGTGVLLWSDNVSTNIPTNSVNLFRQTGLGVAAIQNSTDAASVILNLDYISYTVNRTLSRY